VGASWPDASETRTSESRQVKTAAFDILKRIIVKKSYAKEVTAVKAKRRRQSTRYS